MNKVYLLDTNIVSEFSKQQPNEMVFEFYKARKNLCAISSITWQELIYGVSKIPEGRRKEYVAKTIQTIFNNIEILPYDDFSAEICGKALGTMKKQGQPLPCTDTQIASTAIANGMVLVTHNVKDFSELSERSFLRVEDWFSA